MSKPSSLRQAVKDSKAIDLLDDSDTWSEDSGEHGLGQMGQNVERRKRAAVRVSYDQFGVPQLNLIPSEWRYPTNLGSDQGDHVSAYVLMLEVLIGCKGDDIKKLPDTLYKTVTAIMPDKKDEFKRLRDDVVSKVARERTIRKDTTQHLRKIGYSQVSEVKDRMKKGEVELIANYVEEAADRFVTEVNRMENSAFSGRKKDLSMDVVRTRMNQLVNEKFPDIGRNDFSAFRKIFTDSIGYLETTAENSKKKNQGRKVYDLHDIALEIQRRIASESVWVHPTFSRTGNITLKGLLDFLKEITPLKKESESSAIESLREINDEVARTKKLKKKVSNEIGAISSTELVGNLAAKLFDYPKIGDGNDSEIVLCESLPKHLIFIFSAFKHLQILPKADKEAIYDSFLDRILDKQLWCTHVVQNHLGQSVYLNREILKTEISKIAEIDFEKNHFRMLPKQLRIITDPINVFKDSQSYTEGLFESKTSEILRENAIARGINFPARKIFYKKFSGARDSREITQAELEGAMTEESRKIVRTKIEEFRSKLIADESLGGHLLVGKERDISVPLPTITPAKSEKVSSKNDLEIVGKKLFEATISDHSENIPTRRFSDQSNLTSQKPNPLMKPTSKTKATNSGLPPIAPRK
ncbi:MAG: hypothetical protein EBS06_03555 [Proteobacteria bacterium]|nr:hypothetical protein [Pseudomonadota bacterium]